MFFGDDQDSNVAVRERPEELTHDEQTTARTSARLEREICPNCRILLSVIETRMGKCRTCHTELKSESN
ncbi:MAG: hypothetical protein R6V07_17170 [Armatimonadota bacterium]